MACASAVLVGGAGTRMGGRAKPLLPLGAGVILDHVLARLAPQVGALCLCAHDRDAAWTRFGAAVVTDGTGERRGPLCGIAAGLDWAEGQGFTTALIVPGDTPFLPPDLLARLGAAPSVAVAGGRVHPLVCHLPVTVRPVLAEALTRGHGRVGEALDALGARHVAFAEETAFLNINTPSDYRAAQARLADAAPPQSPTP